MVISEAAETCRNTLVIRRAEALVPIVEAYALQEYKEWAVKQLNDYIERASWDNLRYPLVRQPGSYTALDWPIFGGTDDPRFKEARERVADLLQIARAAKWPLVWYEANGFAFNEDDEEELQSLVAQLHHAFVRRDYTQVAGLTETGTFFVNHCNNQAMDVLKREELEMIQNPAFRVGSYNWDSFTIEERFDGRIVDIVPMGQGKKGVFTIGPDKAGFEKAVALKAVRSPEGWLLAR